MWLGRRKYGNQSEQFAGVMMAFFQFQVILPVKKKLRGDLVAGLK